MTRLRAAWNVLRGRPTMYRIGPTHGDRVTVYECDPVAFGIAGVRRAVHEETGTVVRVEVEEEPE